jgi:hypothetical protein
MAAWPCIPIKGSISALASVTSTKVKPWSSPVGELVQQVKPGVVAEAEVGVVGDASVSEVGETPVTPVQAANRITALSASPPLTTSR